MNEANHAQTGEEELVSKTTVQSWLCVQDRNEYLNYRLLPYLSFKFVLFLSLFKKNVYYLLLSIIHPMIPWDPPFLFSTESLSLCLPLLCLPYRSSVLSCHWITLVYCYFCFLAFVTELFQRGLEF